MAFNGEQGGEALHVEFNLHQEKSTWGAKPCEITCVQS